MTELKALQSIRCDFSVLASMRSNERLRVKRSQFKKTASPFPMREHYSFILLIISKIIQGIHLVVQALGRTWTKQSADRSIRHINTIVKRSFEYLEDHQGQLNILEYRELFQIKLFAQKAVDQGLVNYRETVKSYRPWLLKDKEADKQRRLVQLDDSAHRIQDLIEIVNGKIKILEASDEVRKDDEKNTQAILCTLYKLKTGSKPDVDENRLMLRKNVQKTLSSVFGERHTRIMFHYYGLLNAAVMSATDVKAVITGLVTNVTIKDLEFIYNKKSCLPVKRYGDTFSDLSSKKEIKYLKHLRDIIYPDIQKNVLKKTPYQKQLKNDLGLLKSLKKLKQFQYESHPDRQAKLNAIKSQFGYSEFLSRVIVYKLCHSKHVEFKEGLLIPLYSHDARPSNGDKMKKKLVEAHSLYHDKGIFSVLLTPVRPHPDKPSTAYLLFRGTKDKDSVFRDISLFEKKSPFKVEGPGRQSFARVSRTILKRLIKGLAPFSDQGVTLDVMGHSLGGTDAQRMTHIIVKEMAEESNRLKCVKRLKMNAYNAPAIEKRACREFCRAVEKMDVPVIIRYFDVHRDFLQNFGRVRIGFPIGVKKKPDNLHVTAMRFHRPKKIKIELEFTAIEKGVGRALLRSPLRPLILQLAFRADAHSKMIFSNEDEQFKKRINGTFMQKIYTTNLEDVWIQYGEKQNLVSEISPWIELVKPLSGIGLINPKKKIHR